MYQQQKVDPTLCVTGNTYDQKVISKFAEDFFNQNKLIAFPLVMECPLGCNCKNEKKLWYHLACGGILFLDEYGDVVCQNYKSKNCQQFFIQYAQFQCCQLNLPRQWQLAAQVIMQWNVEYPDFSIDDQFKVRFIINMNQNTSKRWKR